MANWVRLWDDMPDDPKWRLIARRSKASISEVIAVFTRMMVLAGKSTPRGSIAGWNIYVEAAALDMDEDLLREIYNQMQGFVLNGDILTGWEKRQPNREDGSADRAKQWRSERKRTQANASERPEADTEADTDTEVAAAHASAHEEKPFSKDDNDNLMHRLRGAAGYETSPAPGLYVTGPISMLMGEGFDLEGEILPTIRAKAMSMTRPAQSWAYFVPIIRDARDKAQTPSRQQKPPWQSRPSWQDDIDKLAEITGTAS